MPIAEFSLIVGYLAAWAVRKAKRAGGRADQLSDQIIDDAFDNLDILVRDKLGQHPAIGELDSEAAAEAAIGTEAADLQAGRSYLDQLTAEQLVLALRVAVSKDAGFGQRLEGLVQNLQSAYPIEPSRIVFNLNVSDQGQGFQSGRDQHIAIHQPDRSAPES